MIRSLRSRPQFASISCRPLSGTTARKSAAATSDVPVMPMPIADAGNTDAAGVAHEGSPIPSTDRERRTRMATRRWFLAGFASLASAMLCTFSGALDVLAAPLETFVTLIGAAAVFASLAPTALMRELERDDSEAISLLADRAVAFADGDRRLPLQDLALDRGDDLGRLSCALRDLAAEARSSKQHARLVSRRIGHHVQRETTRATAHLQREAMTDPLTGLGNRRAFRQQVEQLIGSRAARVPVAVMVIDMDQFKRINDALGHAEGDRCLCFLAQVLRTTLRAGDVIVRHGGDEFVALMPNANTTNAGQAAQRMQSLFAQMPWGHAIARPSLSIGIAGGNSAELTHDGSLLERADAAVYAAKQQGRSRTVVFCEIAQAA